MQPQNVENAQRGSISEPGERSHGSRRVQREIALRFGR
jgi:hypothetical protein